MSPAGPLPRPVLYVDGADGPPHALVVAKGAPRELLVDLAVLAVAMARARHHLGHVVEPVEAEDHPGRLDGCPVRVDSPSRRVHDGLERQRGAAAVSRQDVVAPEAGGALEVGDGGKHVEDVPGVRGIAARVGRRARVRRVLRVRRQRVADRGEGDGCLAGGEPGRGEALQRGRQVVGRLERISPGAAVDVDDPERGVGGREPRRRGGAGFFRCILGRDPDMDVLELVGRTCVGDARLVQHGHCKVMLPLPRRGRPAVVDIGHGCAAEWLERRMWSDRRGRHAEWWLVRKKRSTVPGLSRQKGVSVLEVRTTAFSTREQGEMCSF